MTGVWFAARVSGRARGVDAGAAGFVVCLLRPQRRGGVGRIWSIVKCGRSSRVMSSIRGAGLPLPSGIARRLLLELRVEVRCCRIKL